MLILLLMVNPYLFGVNSIEDSKHLIVLVFVSTFFIPAFAVGMMRATGLVKSFQMESRQDRIIPYIMTGIFYMWMFRTILDHPNIPLAYKIFVLGATIGLFVAFFVNLFSKVSAHAVGMGGLVAMILITTLLFSYGHFIIELPFGNIDMSMPSLLMIAIILAGIVCTSRLLLNAHNIQDLYGGFIIGFGTQFLALGILM